MKSARLSRRHFVRGMAGLAGGLLVACSDKKPAAVPPLLARPAENVWPEMFWQADAETQETYRYAVANQESLRYIPCFCGCNEMGHTSVFDCYVRDIRKDGTVVLDPMSFG